MKVTKTEFWIDDGTHVVFDLISQYVMLYKHAHMSLSIKSKRAPTIENAIWIAKNHPMKELI